MVNKEKEGITRRDFLKGASASTVALVGLLSGCRPKTPEGILSVVPSRETLPSTLTPSPASTPESTLASSPTPTLAPTPIPTVAEILTGENIEKEDFLVFLEAFQKKVAEKRELRGQKDPDYLRRVDSELNEHRVNLLLLGLDRRTEEARKGESNWRVDAPLVVSVNTQTGQIDLLRIPRDLHAPEVDDLSEKYQGSAFRINAVTVFGGLEDARRVFEDATGLSQDFCFSLDFGAFKDIVDLLGGVEINVDADFVKRYQKEINEWADGEIKPGQQLLNSQFAFDYVHWREKDNDFFRGQRQMEMVQAIAQTAIVRTKDNPLFVLKIAQFIWDLKKNEGIDFASEFSIFDFMGMINSLKSINLEEIDNFKFHNPWPSLIGSGRTEDRYQQYFKNLPIEDPEDPLDYWRPLREYVAQNFKTEIE